MARWDEVRQGLEWEINHDLDHTSYYDSERDQFWLQFSTPEGQYILILEIADERERRLTAIDITRLPT